VRREHDFSSFMQNLIAALSSIFKNSDKIHKLKFNAKQQYSATCYCDETWEGFSHYERHIMVVHIRKFMFSFRIYVFLSRYLYDLQKFCSRTYEICCVLLHINQYIIHMYKCSKLFIEIYYYN